MSIAGDAHSIDQLVPLPVIGKEYEVDQRETLAVVYVGDPLTARLRSNPRWVALMRTMNLEP